MINAVILVSLRSSVRGICNIDGNLFWDLVTCLFLWPQVFCQLSIEMKNYDSHTNDDDDVNDNVNVDHDYDSRKISNYAESFDGNSSKIVEA